MGLDWRLTNLTEESIEWTALAYGPTDEDRDPDAPIEETPAVLTILTTRISGAATLRSHCAAQILDPGVSLTVPVGDLPVLLERAEQVAAGYPAWAAAQDMTARYMLRPLVEAAASAGLPVPDLEPDPNAEPVEEEEEEAEGEEDDA